MIEEAMRRVGETQASILRKEIIPFRARAGVRLELREFGRKNRYDARWDVGAPEWLAVESRFLAQVQERIDKARGEKARAEFRACLDTKSDSDLARLVTIMHSEGWPTYRQMSDIVSATFAMLFQADQTMVKEQDLLLKKVQQPLSAPGVSRTSAEEMTRQIQQAPCSSELFLALNGADKEAMEVLPEEAENLAVEIGQAGKRFEARRVLEDAQRSKDIDDAMRLTVAPRSSVFRDEVVPLMEKENVRAELRRAGKERGYGAEWEESIEWREAEREHLRTAQVRITGIDIEAAPDDLKPCLERLPHEALNDLAAVLRSDRWPSFLAALDLKHAGAGMANHRKWMARSGRTEASMELEWNTLGNRVRELSASADGAGVEETRAAVGKSRCARLIGERIAMPNWQADSHTIEEETQLKVIADRAAVQFGSRTRPSPVRQ
jgi:hypothetical protein